MLIAILAAVFADPDMEALGKAQSELSGYYACAEIHARNLEASGETADIVARAAVETCNEVRGDMRKAMLAAGIGGAALEKLLSESDQQASRDALARVVQMRACRHTPGCKP